MGLDAILARTAARKAAGVIPDYTHPAPAGRATTFSLPVCARGGTDDDIIERCPTCNGGGRHVRECEVHGRCTRDRVNPSVMDCHTCRASGLGFRAPWVNGVATYDHRALFPGLPGRRFNTSLIAWGDGYVLCWRDGWAGSNLWACRLDREFTPIGPARALHIDHPESTYGREDPQLFVHEGTLYVAFVGVVLHKGSWLPRVLYARLSAALGVEQVFAPKAPGVSPGRWEKNWGWFSHGGDLFAVYSISPHRVLKVSGNEARWVHETPFPGQWSGGEMRGGAPPVLVGGEFWSFFHDSVDVGGRKRYRTGLYTFDAAPPFAPVRWVPEPVAVADPRTQPAADPNYCDVLFPRGAALDGSGWVVSFGVHDRHTELRKFDRADLERRLVPLVAS